MKGKRYTTEEKIRELREVDGGKPIRELCQEKNISEATYHRWRKQFGLKVDEARRLKELERENSELKREFRWHKHERARILTVRTARGSVIRLRTDC